MQAYSDDLRQRVATACDSGQFTLDEVASGFTVSVSIVNKLLRRQRTTGSVAALPPGAAPPRACKPLTTSVWRPVSPLSPTPP